MTAIEKLRGALTTLGLKAVEAKLENLLEQASKSEPSYADFLDQLLGCEVDARRTRYLRARLQLAHFPFVKTFAQFDFAFQPSIDERQIRELRTLRFVHEASNVILLGPPGVGKTHLSVSLAEAAIQSGFGAGPWPRPEPAQPSIPLRPGPRGLLRFRRRTTNVSCDFTHNLAAIRTIIWPGPRWMIFGFSCRSSTVGWKHKVARGTKWKHIVAGSTRFG